MSTFMYGVGCMFLLMLTLDDITLYEGVFCMITGIVLIGFGQIIEDTGRIK